MAHAEERSVKGAAHARAARRWQLSRRGEGHCTVCGAEAVTADYCERHRQAVNDNRAKRDKTTYASRRAANLCVVSSCPNDTRGTAYCDGCLAERAARRTSAA